MILKYPKLRLSDSVVLTQNDPRRRVVAGAFFASQLAVDAGLDQPRCNRRTQQEMIEPQAGVARPAVALVIPEREHRLGRMEFADRVTPALRDEGFECRAALRLDQRILVP